MGTHQGSVPHQLHLFFLLSTSCHLSLKEGYKNKQNETVCKVITASLCLRQIPKGKAKQIICETVQEILNLLCMSKQTLFQSSAALQKVQKAHCSQDLSAGPFQRHKYTLCNSSSFPLLHIMKKCQQGKGNKSTSLSCHLLPETEHLYQFSFPLPHLNFLKLNSSFYLLTVSSPTDFLNNFLSTISYYVLFLLLIFIFHLYMCNHFFQRLEPRSLKSSFTFQFLSCYA